jgi:hypothetical protein
VWLLDRAFIDAPFWDAKQRAFQITMITRMKSNLCVDFTEGLPIADGPVNVGVTRDLRVTLASSRATWRRITYRTRRGWELPFLINDFSRLLVMVAFLYFRRWKEEKCFDTWKTTSPRPRPGGNYSGHQPPYGRCGIGG